MKEENKILIRDIQEALQEMEQYPNPARAFRIGWDGWRTQCLRHGRHSTTFFAQKWKEGWLSRDDAAELCEYLKKGWNPGFL